MRMNCDLPFAILLMSIRDDRASAWRDAFNRKSIFEIRTFSMRLLDRYVLQNFLRAYLYCIAAFISIWLIFDISDNISTFLDERISRLAW